MRLNTPYTFSSCAARDTLVTLADSYTSCIDTREALTDETDKCSQQTRLHSKSNTYAIQSYTKYAHSNPHWLMRRTHKNIISGSHLAVAKMDVMFALVVDATRDTRCPSFYLCLACKLHEAVLSK